MSQMVYGIYENEYGSDYVSPSGRMYVHSSVYLPSSEIDPRTGFLKPDYPRRGRTQAKAMEYARLHKEYEQLNAALKARDDHPGVRVSRRAAFLMVMFAVLIFGLLLIVQQGRLTEKQQAVNRVFKEIESNQKDNAELEAKIAEASNSAAICYAAARNLNMIPGEAAEAIHLVAMDTRPLEIPKEVPEAQPVHMQAHTDIQDQDAYQQGTPDTIESTVLPVIASADIR